MISCKDCKYSAMIKDPTGSLVKVCQYNPPTPCVVPIGNGVTIMSAFPMVEPSWTCSFGELGGTEFS